jgi:hypothetical protein
MSFGYSCTEKVSINLMHHIVLHSKPVNGYG